MTNIFYGAQSYVDLFLAAMGKPKAIYKWGMSFLKSDRTIEDYPVRFKEQGKDYL